ncbi:TPA: hypothetical protein DCX66_00235 [Candidatus Nomurabacteria bacterium]|nr:MAG: Transcriptional regulator, TrmB [Candidatus Nomurabacteria bacterium GW2011_GWF1_34_20]KKP62877.1 MAG: Transcriptional regulator, TrmB [Candidatus Nomurabacteria bacterium GW2011_GWE2_34_25]HAE36703.1 hypothetical protein [Candidatus Nomurabacteria bacterium]HAX64897.1 hypothetical protein [Candidatus Nomurabacteria bacterium]HCU01648.1 hypothetical protein [Candidatus Nomurabacteria bacterium]
MIDKTLEKLGLKDEEIKIFLYLLENGEQTAGNLAKKAGLPRPSLYGFLKNLQKNGIVIESQKNGIKTFLTCKEEQIKNILDEKIKELEKGKNEIHNLFFELQKGNIITSPRLQFFEGKDGVSHVLKDILLYSNIETKTYWPIKAMLEILGEDFFRKLNKERIKRNIYNRAIWPQSQKVDIKKHPYLGVGENFLREIRLAPKEVEFSMGYWIYENKVVFVSSKKECFGFIIESKEFAEMLSSQFDSIWKQSKIISIPDKYTKKFLDDIK